MGHFDGKTSFKSCDWVLVYRIVQPKYLSKRQYNFLMKTKKDIDKHVSSTVLLFIFQQLVLKICFSNPPIMSIIKVNNEMEELKHTHKFTWLFINHGRFSFSGLIELNDSSWWWFYKMKSSNSIVSLLTHFQCKTFN